MKISGETIDRASSSRFARLSVNDDQGSQEVVVCKKSFFSWAVHAIRYRFSSNYREREHRLRASILVGLCEQSSTGGEYPDAFYGDRRGFNTHLITRLNESDSAENFTAGSQGEIRAAEAGATPGNNQVQPGPAVKAKKIARRKQKWSGKEGVESFWEKQGSTIVRDGYKEVFRFECLGKYAGCADVRDEKRLCAKVSGEIAEKFNKDGGVTSQVNSVLGYVLFTTPKGEQKQLFTEPAFIPSEDYIDWGLADTHETPDRHYAFCRLPNERLYGAVNGLLDRHFKAGQSKEKILKGLQQEHDKAGDLTFGDSFRSRGIPPSQPLSKEEFRFCVDAMEKFANAYFDANS